MSHHDIKSKKIKTLSQEQSKAILGLVTDDEKEQFWEAFKVFDKNSDGCISTKVRHTNGK